MIPALGMPSSSHSFTAMIKWFQNTKTGQIFSADEKWAPFYASHTDCVEVTAPPSGDEQPADDQSDDDDSTSDTDGDDAAGDDDGSDDAAGEPIDEAAGESSKSASKSKRTTKKR